LVLPLRPLFGGFAFEVCVSIALFKAIARSRIVAFIKTSSIEEEMVLIEGIVILALTVDITFIK
jgi:hypothetical protein